VIVVTGSRSHPNFLLALQKMRQWMDLCMNMKGGSSEPKSTHAQNAAETTTALGLAKMGQPTIGGSSWCRDTADDPQSPQIKQVQSLNERRVRMRKSKTALLLASIVVGSVASAPSLHAQGGMMGMMQGGMMGMMQGGQGGMMGRGGMMQGDHGGMMGPGGMMQGEQGGMMGQGGMMQGDHGGMTGPGGMMQGDHGGMMGQGGKMQGGQGATGQGGMMQGSQEGMLNVMKQMSQMMRQMSQLMDQYSNMMGNTRPGDQEKKNMPSESDKK
jgi:hypothetical protein